MDIKDILTNAGIEISDEQYDSFNKEFRKNYKSVGEIKKTTDALNSTINDLQTKYDDLSNSSNQNDTKFKQLEQERDSYKSKFESVDKQYGVLQSQFNVLEKGVDKKYAKFVASEVLNNVNETTDFDSAFDDYISKNPQFKEVTTKKVTTTIPLKGNGNEPISTNQTMNDAILRAAGRK